MIDLNINRGLSTVLFSEPGVINPRLIIEEGCWYLCTDTAELFLGIRTEDSLTLKRINESDTDYVEVLEVLRTEINAIKESLSTYAKKTDIPDVSNLVTEEALKAAIDAIEPPLVDLTDYATKEAVAAVEAKIPLVDGLASEDYVDEKVAAIEIPEVNLDGYATETFVQGELNKINIPDVSKFVTTETFSTALAIKANEVPFTSAKFITKPFGNFVYGESVKDLSIVEIFAKLLGLVDKDPNVQEPTEPGSIIENIITNELPMYTVTANSTLEEVPYKLLTFTEEEATAIATEPCFYQIIDVEGNVIESGYQELQVKSDEVYYVIALPKDIDYSTMVSVKAWDSLKSQWTDTGTDKPALTSDSSIVTTLCEEAGIDISNINTLVYTVWVLEDFPTGSKLRFVINE